MTDGTGKSLPMPTVPQHVQDSLRKAIASALAE